MPPLRFARVETSLGPVWVAETDTGVAAVTRSGSLEALVAPLLRRFPGAARAVGNAMARCPLFPAVPCHRVVRASDGWSGWGGDPALKRRLLEAERRESSRSR